MNPIWLAVKTFFGGIPTTVFLVAGGLALAGIVTWKIYGSGEEAAQSQATEKSLEHAIEANKPVSDRELERVRQEYRR